MGAPEFIARSLGRSGEPASVEAMLGGPAGGRLHQRLARNPLVPNQRVVEVEEDSSEFHPAIQTRW
jgi:hypothetical protein